MKSRINIYILLLVLTIFSNCAYSQETKIKGFVKNTKNEAISNANVVAFEDSTLLKVMSYSISNEDGLFELKIVKPNPIFFLKISFFGYKPLITKLIIPIKQPLDFVLEEDAIELKEVVVIADVLKDTVNIKTQNLNLVPTSSLRDILNKTEGFMVSKEGSISYQGVPITKVLINKKEVFINQNKIALDNLNYEIMDKLQIINNYKDNFKVDFDNFTTSVINVNTKKDFKGVLKEKIIGALGFNESYELKVKGMFFSDSFNAFLTHNTNNIGEKELSFEDISESSLNKSSGFFKNNFLTFFTGDDLLRKNLNSNTSLTIRRQGEKLKMGFVCFLDFLESLKSNQNTTNIIKTNSLVKKELNSLSELGRFLSTKYYLSKKLSKNSVLDFNVEIGTVKKDNSENNEINNYGLSVLNIFENNKTIGISTYISNSLNYSNLLSERVLLNANINYTTENSSNDFKSLFSSSSISNGNVLQSFKLTQKQIQSELNVQYKFSNLFSLELGGVLSVFNHDYSIYELQPFTRKGTNTNMFISGRGKTKQVDYALALGLESYQFSSSSIIIRALPKIDLQFDYKLNSNNSINLGYNQNNSLFDLYKNLDTLAVSFNNRILGNSDYNYTITNARKASIGYYYSNIAKSKSFQLIGRYDVKNNYLERIFNKVENNIFYYQNYLINSKNNLSLSLGAKKGFYFGQKLNKIEFLISSNAKITSFPTIFDNITKLYDLKGQSYSFGINFIPKDFLLTEINVSYLKNTQKIYVDNIFFNEFISEVYVLDLTANHGKFEGKLSLSKINTLSSNTFFSVPLMDVKASYKVGEKLSIFTKGKSLFNLFKLNLNDVSSISQISDGILLNENINFYRINYLIFGLNINF